MSKRRKRIILLACGIFVLAVLWQLLRDREPSYQGRTLSEWVQAYTSTASPRERDQAKQAIVQIGSNAVPSLLRSIRYTSPLWKKFSIGMFQKLQNFSVTRAIVPRALTIDNSAVRAEIAILGFKVLGQAAEPALPELTQLACDSAHRERSERAIRTILLIRPVADTAIGKVLSTAAPQTQLKTLRYIAVTHDQSLIRDLLPSLIKCLREGDDDVAKCAAFIITELKHSEPKATLAILIDGMKHPSSRVRAQVIECIGTFEAGAASATPSLVQFLADSDPLVRTQARMHCVTLPPRHSPMRLRNKDRAIRARHWPHPRSDGLRPPTPSR